MPESLDLRSGLRVDATGRRAGWHRAVCSTSRLETPMGELTCMRCSRLIALHETFEVCGSQVAHHDCRKRHDLSHDERTLLFRYCFNHEVATCPTCSQEFRQCEL